MFIPKHTQDSQRKTLSQLCNNIIIFIHLCFKKPKLPNSSPNICIFHTQTQLSSVDDKINTYILIIVDSIGYSNP